METNKKQHFISLFILPLLLSCSGEKKETAQTETISNKAIVRVETVSAQDVEQINEFTATVEANISNNIAPQTPVRIDKLFAEVGDHVKAGQLLVKMDETNLKQTKIQLDNQELEFKRIDELYKVGGASKSAWDAQKTQLDVSRAAYKNLQENTQLLSPVTGVVTARNYDSGDMYSGGSPIFTVEQIRPVKLLVNVSESLFTKVKKEKMSMSGWMCTETKCSKGKSAWSTRPSTRIRAHSRSRSRSTTATSVSVRECLPA